MSILRDGDIVALKTVNGKFISARKDASVIETTLCKDFEHFIVEASSSYEGKLCFKTFHGTYLSAKNGRDNLTQSPHAQETERFRPQLMKNKIDLCTTHATYLSASGNGYISQTSWAKENEKFYLYLILAKLHPGDRIALKSFHGLYLTEDIEKKTIVQKEKMTSASILTVEKQGLDGSVSLLTASQKYLSCQSDGTLSLSTVIQNDQLFQPEYLASQNILDQINFLGRKFVDVEPKLISLKSNHGTYLSARRDFSFNFQTWVRTYEQFDLRRL